MEYVLYIITFFCLVCTSIGLYYVPRRLFLLYKKTNIGIIPYTEVQEEIITIWVLVIVSLFGLYIDFIYLVIAALTYVVYNLLKHVWDLINLEKHKKTTIIDYYYSKPNVKEYIEESDYNNDNISFKYSQKHGLNKIMLTNYKEEDIAVFVRKLQEDTVISNFKAVDIQKEKSRLWVFLIIQVLFNVFITWYLLIS